MRALLCCLLVALCIPSAASATIVTLPAAPGEVPRGLALGTGGRGALVTQTGQNGGPLNVIQVPTGQRRSFPDSTVLGRAVRRDGGVEFLVQSAANPLGTAEVMLRRVMPSGRVYGWLFASRARVGAIARGRDRTIAAWAHGSTLRLHVARDKAIGGRARVVRLGLSSYAHLALALDPRGRLTIVAMSPREGLVVAAVTQRGRVLRRQRYRTPSGLLHTAVTARGRVGVLVEDTGIEGDVGECAADGRGRHLRAVVRAPLAERFGPLQTIESPPFGCGSGGALLLATGDEGLTAIYQGGSYDRPPLIVRSALARSGHSFGRPFSILSDARADTAVVTRDGLLTVGLLRRTVSPEVFAGALTLLHAPDAFVQVDPGPAFAPLLALDAAGRQVLAWRTADALKVAP